jgi:putative ABC transport system substrate-binding protein
MAPLLDAKRVQFLRELRPQLKRLGVLYNPNDQGATKHLGFAREAAGSFGITVLPIEVRTRDDGPAAVAEMEVQRLDALLVVADPIANFAFDRVAQAAAKMRLPTMCEFREFVKRGCLFGYGATLTEFNERVAGLVEQILRGARPADLPIQQVTRLEFVVNQRLAHEIDVVFPQAMLLRADGVID